MSVNLTHIGEVLSARMVNAMRWSFIELCGLEDIAEKKFISNRHYPIAFPNAKLIPPSGLRFDGESRVDLVVMVREKLGVPFELKLGKTCLSKKHVDEKWLSDCKFTHGNACISGRMMAILDRRFPPMNREYALSVLINDRPVTLTRDWFILARAKVAQKWTGNARPALSHLVRFIPFESMVQNYGGRMAFNALVRDIVSFDYFEKWVASS